MEDGSSPPPVARHWHVLGFVLLVAVGLYAVIVALRLGLWRQNSPGEGLFPFLAASSMTVFGLVGLAGVLRAPDPAGGGEPGDLRATLLRVGAYLAALVFYALTLDALGFIASTIIVVVFILRAAEGYSWRITLALAVGTAAVCHVLFVRWLGAILPTGYLWDRFLY